MATALDMTGGVKGVLVKETDGKGYGLFAAKLFKEGNIFSMFFVLMFLWLEVHLTREVILCLIQSFLMYFYSIFSMLIKISTLTIYGFGC